MKDNGYKFIIDMDWNLHIGPGHMGFSYTRISEVLMRLRERLRICRKKVYEYDVLDSSIFCNRTWIVRETEKYLSKYDKSKLSKKTLLKANMLYHPLIEGTTFGCLPLSNDQDCLDFNIVLNEDKDTSYIYLEDVGIEKFIDLMLPDEIFSLMIDQLIVIEVGNDKFYVVDKENEEYFGQSEIVYRTSIYSPKVLSEIAIEIRSDTELDRNLLKDVITRTIEFYEKNYEFMLKAIADYYSDRYFDLENEFNDGLFGVNFLNENYPIVESEDIKSLITVPIIMIENIDDVKKNKFSFSFEVVFDEEHGMRIDIENDKITYIGIYY